LQADGEESATLRRKFREKAEAAKGRPKSVVIKDIPTLIIDLGSSTIKVGFGGEDAPILVTSAVVGHVRGEQFMDLEKHAHVDKARSASATTSWHN
jgi:actin-related protein